MSAPLFKTPLHAWHVAQGAKMAPFAGWDMPIQYVGIIAEHMHTRTEASLFDICHMGEFLLVGAGAKDALAKVVTHNLETLLPGKCRYGFLLQEDGCVRDDLIVYCLGRDEYMLVVNGACTASDFAWIAGQLPASLSLDNISDATAKIDLQGPKAFEVLHTVLGDGFRSLKYFNFARTTFEGAPLIVSRTGYTGELGYEFYLPTDKALALWERLTADPRAKAAGLGARDTLRLEMGYPLYGQDLDAAHTPSEAGYEALLNSQAEYTGKGADRRVASRLVALAIPGRRSARHYDPVFLPSGEEVGAVTSGSFAPSLGHAVALAFVTPDAAANSAFVIKGARVELEAERRDLPFFLQGTARMKLE